VKLIHQIKIFSFGVFLIVLGYFLIIPACYTVSRFTNIEISVSLYLVIAAFMITIGVLLVTMIHMREIKEEIINEIKKKKQTRKKIKTPL
jgi:hypothetical protein